jgi:hypothetical protein
MPFFYHKTPFFSIKTSIFTIKMPFSPIKTPFFTYKNLKNYYKKAWTGGENVFRARRGRAGLDFGPGSQIFFFCCLLLAISHCHCHCHATDD